MLVELIDVFLVVLNKNWIPFLVIVFRVEKQHVVDFSVLSAALPGVAMGAGEFSNDLRPEVNGTEDGVQ